MTDFRLFGAINLGLPLALAAIYDRNVHRRFKFSAFKDANLACVALP
nr:hypothetical protein [uncultured Campylobacter sp.]